MNRDIDVQIAEKVMGWEIFESKYGYYSISIPGEEESRTTNYWDTNIKFDPITGKKFVRPEWWELCSFIPQYSTNIADAWQVVEKVRELNFSIQITTSVTKGKWVCEISEWVLSNKWIVVDEYPAAAICLAALAAINKPTE